MVFLDVSGRRWKKIKLAGWLAIGSMVLLILPAIFAVVGIQPDWGSLSPIKQAQAWASSAAGDRGGLEADAAPAVVDSRTNDSAGVMSEGGTAAQPRTDTARNGDAPVPGVAPPLNGISPAPVASAIAVPPAGIAPQSGAVFPANPPATAMPVTPVLPDAPPPASWTPPANSPGLAGSAPPLGSGPSQGGVTLPQTPASGYAPPAAPAASGRTANASSHASPAAPVLPPPFSS